LRQGAADLEAAANRLAAGIKGQLAVSPVGGEAGVPAGGGGFTLCLRHWSKGRLAGGGAAASGSEY